MMIPITRKEKYINEIVGGGNTAPETPQTREELFFADILGEVVAPSPITRAEKYLAKIANKYSGELPEPVTRIEQFLARAAGMNVSIPTPVTREEMFWADYALIVEKEISGIPPLTFKSNGRPLKNYRIYGNTVNGQSVGDKTSNMFDISRTIKGKFISPEGIEKNAAYNEITRLNHSDFIAVSSLTDYTYSALFPQKYDFDNNLAFCWYDINQNFIKRDIKYIHENTDNMSITKTSPNNAAYLIVNFMGLNYEESIMLNEGSASLPYEPYGYKIPVTVTSGTNTKTTNIYLDEPLTKQGDNADYIDYAAQKRHNSDGTESSITLPEIAVTAGSNTLTVGTEVQPSNVYIKYEGER